MYGGVMEFELYDRDYLESERADIWRVEARATGLLFAALAQRLGIAVDSADDFLDALARAFASWTAFKAWLDPVPGFRTVQLQKTTGVM